MMHFPLPWSTEFGVIVFCGLAVFAYFGEWTIAALAPVFTREREEGR